MEGFGARSRCVCNLTKPRQGRGAVIAFWPRECVPPSEVWAEGGGSPEALAPGRAGAVTWCGLGEAPVFL